MDKTPVVFLGANHYTALGGIRTFGRRGIKVYALDYDFSSAYALASRYVYRKVQCPNLNQSEQEFIDFLIEFAAGFDEKPVLVPYHDSYAIAVSNHSGQLSQHYLMYPNPPGLVAEIIDKTGLYRLAEKHGMQMPKTFCYGPGADKKELAAKAPYPCIIKPALSHKFVKVFRQKVFVVFGPDQLLSALEKADKAGIDVMVQQIIPGCDDHMYMLDALIDLQGRASHTMTAQKLRQFPVNFGSSTITRQVYVPELVQPGTEFLENIGYRGFAEIEFKRHADTGQFYMIEINARVTSFNSLLDACGMEFLYYAYRELTGNPVPPKHLQENLNIAFYHFYEDIFSVRGYLKSKQMTLGQALRPLLTHKKVYAVWAADDPRPAFVFLWRILQKGLRKFFRR